MTTKQRLLKRLYPVLMFFKRLKSSSERVLVNENHLQPHTSIFDLHAEGIDEKPFHFSNLRGKKILLVNTASDCGYTAQYAELQQLQNIFRDSLVVVAFPSNDFGEQETGTHEEIEQLCRRNFGVAFPLMKKSSVRRGTNQNPVFAWLSSRDENGWISQPPTWNFCKYLVDERGVFTAYFPPFISPLSNEMRSALR